MATKFRESAEFLRGRDAEQLVAAYLQGRGWYIIPSYDYSGEHGDKAPTIQGAHDGIVLPDLGIAKAGMMKWAEVKAKGGPTFTLKTKTYDHGIGYRKWCHYLRVQQETGCHVWLFIIEECSQILLAESLDVLGDGRRYDDNKMDKGGMVFWPRESFSCRVMLDAIPGLFDPKKPLPFESQP
jgi:hypothetical protein